MVQSLETLIVALLVIIVIFVALLFLPAIIELKKPKDAEPRVLIRFCTYLFEQFLYVIDNYLRNLKAIVI